MHVKYSEILLPSVEQSVTEFNTIFYKLDINFY